MSRTVNIVALAARTPVGTSAETSAAAVRAGISRLREHPFIVDPAGDRLRCGCDGLLDPQLLGPERLGALASSTLSEVFEKLAQGRRHLPDDMSLLLALPEPRPGFGPSDAQRSIQTIGTALEKAGIPLRIERTGDGHCGVLSALERGAARIASGQTDLCVVGGVDSYLHADTLAWLDADRRLDRTGTRSGFAPGEGAAMVVLASTSAAKTLGLSVLGRVQAVASVQEKRDPRRDAGTLGEALTNAILRVAGDHIAERAYVDDVYCDINGERTRATDWGFTLLRAGPWFRDGTQYVMPVGACGDLGAATAAFNIVLAVRAWQRRYARGPRALVWAASWSGQRSAALIERGEG